MRAGQTYRFTIVNLYKVKREEKKENYNLSFSFLSFFSMFLSLLSLA